MDATPTLELTATHTRRSATATTSLLAGASAVVLGIAALGVLLLGGSDDPSSLDCTVGAPSEACLAYLPEELQALPPAELGVWYYADHADVKQSPRRYLEAQAAWAAEIPAGTSGAEAVGSPEGRVPSSAALEGELRMREAVLPEHWQPASTTDLRILALPFGIGALGLFGLAVVLGIRSRSWTPIPVRVTEDHVSIGTEQLQFEDLMSIDVAPLRLVSTEKDLVLPPGYDLPPSDHEKLVDVLQTAMAKSRDDFMDDLD